MASTNAAVANSGDDDRPRRFAAKPDDPAMHRVLDELVAMRKKAVILGFPCPPAFNDAPSKSIFYPSLGRITHLKSFQFQCIRPAGDTKANYCWIEAPESGSLLHHYQFTPSVEPQAVPFSPSLSKADALEKCKSFAGLLTRQQGIFYVTQDIEFVQDINLANAAAPNTGAYWRAHFQRVSKGGIRILEDGLTVSIVEKIGLRSFLNTCLASIDIPANEKPLVKQDEVAGIAETYAQRVKNEGPAVKGHFGQHRLSQRPERCDLLITCPNDILTCRDFSDIKRKEPARLVWVFTFRLADPKNKLASGVLLIYIDALTGALLGGMC